ncbi:hypothetical protein IMZ08_13800 [Bacillus luteolus]|uniref:Uncharacterized protein n=1 Tax=Litchfieldia luteola TaxID=682179 RepID=A0ABR9QKX7_9BACI|nr:hypothetical protein [Cytobacillus luteolus]MBE4909137.1 hypothetical protein [Cytobacillus luteolus]MBP1940412.1 hypothetical protein [Cytobacillus luteolus]
MKKEFNVTYDGHHIQVINTWFNGEKLYVDGKLQDQNLGLGLSRASLTGTLRSSNDVIKNIKVRIGGNFSIQCRIFIDNVLIYPTNVE